MRASLRLLFVVAALACFAAGVHALELSSELRHTAPSSSSAETLAVSRSQCSADCSNENLACTEECAFNSEIEELEWTCRAQCTRLTTQCLQSCVNNDKPAAPRKHKPAPPRPASENTGYGPEKVLNWAGYITVNSSIPNVNRHLWYWAFESRNNPATDPLVIWLTGGPGCSSLVALFAENGPYIIQDDLSLTLNPYSWNNNATVIWIDQPTRTGYSYSDSEDPGVFSENEVAENLYQFIQNFNQQYPKYANNPFVISGESYAGHYIPAFAYRVLQGNQDPTFPKINLEAIAIGNGLVDPQVQYTQYLPFVVANKILSNFSIGVMQSGLAGCEAAIALCAQNSTLGLEACLGAYEVCNLAELMPYQASGLNVYDFTQKCEIPPLCYNFSSVDAFLAQPDVQQALGVVGRTWQDCNRIVDLELVFAGDWMLNLAPKVVDILASDIRVVAYAGENDYICNWYGGFAWTTQLQWPGQQAFNSATNNTWTLESGQVAGSSISAQGLTFVRVANAGHMVPYNQPVAALDLITRVISGAPFDSSAPTARPSFVDETAAVVPDAVPAPVAPVELIHLHESHSTDARIALY